VKPLDPRLLRHARHSRTGIALLALLGTAQAVATLAVALALTLLIAGSAASGAGGPGTDHLEAWHLGTWHSAAWHWVIDGGRPVAVALLAGAFVTRAGLAWAEQVVAHRTSARVRDELRRSLVRALARRGPAWVARFGAGRLTALLTGGLDALRPWFAGYLPALVLGVALPPLVLLAMAFADPASAVIAFATLPLIPLLGALIGWAIQARAQQRWAADARLAGHFLDVVRGLATLRTFGRAERQTAVVADLTDRHRSATLRVLRVAFLSSTALDVVGTLSVGLIAVEAGLRVAAGHLALGPALLVILLAPEVYRPLREMAARYHAAADATAVIGDVDEVLRDLPPIPATGSTAPGLAAAGLRVRHPGATQDALSLPELVVGAGELVALTGPSGAGKTTALRALAGLQPVNAGTVAVDGPPAYVPQTPSLPHARTVADVFPPATSAAEIETALRAVGLGDDLTAATRLGEHGSGVSAGQRHRLALAAVLQQGPATLLLDEPTAHLDPETEQLVITRLREAAAAGSAIVVAAHRPALLAAADRIIEITPPAAPASDVHPGTAAETDPARASHGAGEVSGSTPVAGPGRRWARWRRPSVAVVLGAGSSVAGLVLTGAAAWLLVRAASLPPVLTLSAAVVLVRGSAVARPLLRYVERLVAHDVAFARLGERRARVYAALIPRVPGPRLRRRGDLLSKVVDDVDAQVDGLLRGWLPAWAGGAALAAGAIVAGWMAPAVVLPLAAGLVVAGVVAPIVAVRRAAAQEAATAAARAALRDAMVETVDGVEELRGGGLLHVPDRRSRELAAREAQAARSAGGAAALAHLGWGLAVTGTALLMARTGLSHEWSAVLLLGVVALGESALALPEAAVARMRAAEAGRRLAELATEPPPATFPGDEADLHFGAVTVRGLVAGWGERAVLDGLDLDLARGAKVAIRGRSGDGKSTLGAVLARLLDARGGQITVGGRDVRAVAEAAVRGRIVLVGDDTGHVFASTVRENLRLARPAAADEELRAVLGRVRLGGWLAGLPDGLDTWLGTGGSTMSGGQARRLATARALLAEPELLILDEPTEGLDEPTARALMDDLLDAADGRTVLMLTHHEEGLDRVDRVLTLRDGRLSDAPLARTVT
jgi:ATP-binding cassette subfamily C protein CydCD